MSRTSQNTEHRSLPVLNERVLPTLNVDGTRRWIRPKLFQGKYLERRTWIGWGLIALFAALPWIDINGKPALLFDVVHREFAFFGLTFYATDGVLLMLLLLAVFLGIFWITSLWGRVWCGYGCPQTVYLEFVFRPIERWLEGSRGRQLKLDREGANGRRVLKYAIYAVLAVVLGNIFLSYFVGARQLVEWLTDSPLKHPAPFLVVLVTSGLVFFDFAYFREQMCTIICPYARLQSVLLDPRSLIIGYDERRGEPRGKGSGKARRQNEPVETSQETNVRGDCIDCNACVVACPTGIDIRQGLQLECVACAQCVDACDGVMAKLGKAPGLIRYGSEVEFKGRPDEGKRLRPRVVLYPLLIAGLLSALFWLGRGSTEPLVTVLRGVGAPYVVESDGVVRNQLRVKIHNRGKEASSFTLSLTGSERLSLIAPENPLLVESDELRTTTLFVEAPRTAFSRGVLPVEVVVISADGFEQTYAYKLLGPM